MPRWSESDLIIHLSKSKKVVAPPSASTILEGKIHKKIEDHLRGLGWCYLHSRMDVESTIAEGAPDFTIFKPGGKPLLIEVKKKGGKASPEQLQFAAWVERDGYKVHFVWSFEEYLNIINGPHHSTTD